MPGSAKADPLLVGVNDAAAMLGVSRWAIYQLIKGEQIESRWLGQRRLIVVESLRSYAAGLPAERPGAAS